MDKLKPHVTGVYVASHQAPGAIEEAIEAEVPLIVAVAEHIPIHDIMRVCQTKKRNTAKLMRTDYVDAEDPVKITLGRGQLPWDNIANWQMQNRVSAITMFYAWPGGNCGQIWHFKL